MKKNIANNGITATIALKNEVAGKTKSLFGLAKTSQTAGGNRESLVSTFCSFLYNGVVNDLKNSKSAKFKWRLIKMILNYIDPEVTVYLGQNKLKMSLSQKTPFYYESFKTYDRALPRICETLVNIDKKLILIDIGANIGDTVSLISEKINGGSILCIEGDGKYLDFLRQNVSTIKNNTIIIEPKFCVDVLENNQFNIESKNGTAHLSISNEKKLENIDTLDNMVDKNKIFANTNLLKIDTDGFEITVLNGAKVLLSNVHPMIFFEFTPEAYITNKQTPQDLINFLCSFGYNKALFYDNFGRPLGIYDFESTQTIMELIKDIDNSKIYYYDILCIHRNDENKYMSVLNKEYYCKE
jgi:FkbM family methyltransferase